jgi:anti-sigma regulatory factor (Ser/Thr protein kinase)
MYVGAEHRLELDPDPSAPSKARAWLRELLPVGNAVSTACLVASELVSNSVRHAWFGAGDRVELVVVMTDDTVRIEVVDPGPGFLRREPELPVPDASRGRGLYLIQQLASRWGVVRDQATRVWAELPLP